MDFTNCPDIETLDTRGTPLGVILPNPTKIKTLRLGAPTSVIINNSTYLGGTGTIVSAESTSNLTNL